MEVVVLTARQLAATLLPAAAMGLALHLSGLLLHRVARQALGRRTAHYAFGLTGTLVHELSHALVARIFGFRIVAMKLFDLAPDAPEPGYVRYAYDPHSLLARLGLLCVGAAPILLGALVVMLLGWLLLGEALFAPWSALRESAGASALDRAAWTEALSRLWAALWSARHDPGLYLFLGASLALGTGMHLSPADLRGVASGVVVLAGLALVPNLILSLAAPGHLGAVPAWVARVLWPFAALMGIVAALNLTVAALLAPLWLVGRLGSKS
jgi:hypothetical protein